MAEGNDSDASSLELDCPIYGNNSDYYISEVHWWVEGVFQTTVAVPGLAGNIIFSVILTRRDLRNSFNLLLVALAFFDSCYIVGAILESIRTCFDMASDVHIILFPYLLYPGQNIAMTVSIFLIVAIAFERRRLLKYLLPVVISAIAFNINRFLESEIYYITELDGDGMNVTHPRLNVTEMRVSGVYMTYVNWSQSIVLGFIPAVMLIYFNTKIYLDIRRRERRKRPRRANNGLTAAGVRASTVTGEGESAPLKNDDDARKSKNGGVSFAHQKTSNVRRRRAEDKMAMIFVAIVIGFLISNFPRIFLNFHEVITQDNSVECMKAGQRSFPVWSRIVGSFSHLFLVLNSGTNILFYCCFNRQFRVEARRAFRQCLGKKDPPPKSRRRLGESEREETKVTSIPSAEVKIVIEESDGNMQKSVPPPPTRRPPGAEGDGQQKDGQPSETAV